MLQRAHDEAGETLLEILIALLIIGLVVGAYLASYATVTTGSKSQRDFATADALLRSAAETTKGAVSHDCVSGNPTYAPAAVSVPAGFSISRSSTPAGLNCPDPSSPSTALQQVTFTVTLPSGTQQKLSIEVRTP